MHGEEKYMCVNKPLVFLTLCELAAMINTADLVVPTPWESFNYLRGEPK